MTASPVKSNTFKRRRQSGFITIIVLFFLLLMAGIMVALSSLSQAQMNSSRKGLYRAKALTLAESGADDAINRLSKNVAYAGTGGPITLEESPGVPFGTYRTTVTSVSPWSRKIVSVGTCKEGESYTLTELVDIKKSKLGSGGLVLKVNGNVDIAGAATILTAPLGGHSANVSANGTIKLGSGSLIDGYLAAYAGVLSGLGLTSNVALGDPEPFLTDEMAAEMKTNWLAQTKAKQMIIRSITATTTLSGSAYIAGDVRLGSGQTLTLGGNGNDVVFVDGDVILTGSARVVNGVTLVVNGVFNQSATSTYKISVDTPTPTLFVYNSANLAVGINLRGGGLLDSQGIIYGLHGDVNISAGATLTGAIYSNDSSASVTSSGNVNLNLSLGMQSSIDIPDGSNVTQVFEL